MDPGHVASLAVLDTLSLHSTIRSKLALQLALVYSFTSMNDTILAGLFFFYTMILVVQKALEGFTDKARFGHTQEGSGTSFTFCTQPQPINTLYENLVCVFSWMIDSSVLTQAPTPAHTCCKKYWQNVETYVYKKCTESLYFPGYLSLAISQHITEGLLI